MVPYYIFRMRQQRVKNPRSGWPRTLPNCFNAFFILARWHAEAVPKVTYAFKLYQPSVFSFYDYYWWLLHADQQGFGFLFVKYFPLVLLCFFLYIAFRKIFTYAVNSPEQIGWAMVVFVIIIFIAIYFLVLWGYIEIPKW
jgi:hypothetical protein